LWVEREPGAGGVAVPETVVYFADVRAVTAGGTVSLREGILAEFEGRAGMGLTAATGSAVANHFFSELPEGEAVPSAEAMRSHPLWRDGEISRIEVPERTRAEAVPHLARPPAPLALVFDTEAAGVAAVRVGEEIYFAVDGVREQVGARVTGIVQLVPTATDTRYEGAVLTNLDGLLQWMSGMPGWSLSGVLAEWSEPQELWLRTGDPNGAARRLTAELGAEPDALLTIGGVSADFSSRPIQVGLVSILFMGTGAGVVLTLAGVTAYVLMAVRRRFREMGVLRALGLRRRSVAATFAVEQTVVLGVGAVVGIGAGLALMRLMLPFLQLGEGGAELLPPALMQLNWGRLAIYLGVVALVLVAAVLWSTRNVSARQLSEVLREVER
jgi:hypothetical protein